VKIVSRRLCCRLTTASGGGVRIFIVSAEIVHGTGSWSMAMAHGPWGSSSSGQRTVDDGQKNSVLFDLSVWPSNVVPYRAGGQRTVDDGQTNSVLFDLSVWPSNVIPYFTSPL
jgi:hypothetical protein